MDTTENFIEKLTSLIGGDLDHMKEFITKKK